jgi:hypothetical protein
VSVLALAKKPMAVADRPAVRAITKAGCLRGTQILAILKGNLPRPAVEIIAESGRKKMPLSVFW